MPVRALLTERRRETARERRGPPVTLRGMESRRWLIDLPDGKWTLPEAHPPAPKRHRPPGVHGPRRNLVNWGHEHLQIPAHHRERRRGATHLRRAGPGSRWRPPRGREPRQARQRTPLCTSTIASRRHSRSSRGGSATSGPESRRGSPGPVRDGRLRAGRAAQVLERWGRGSPGHGPHSTGRQHRVFSHCDLRVAAGERGKPAGPVRGRVLDEAVPVRVLHDGDPGGGTAFRLPSAGDGRAGAEQVQEVRRRPRTGEAVSGTGEAAQRHARKHARHLRVPPLSASMWRSVPLGVRVSP